MHSLFDKPRDHKNFYAGAEPATHAAFAERLTYWALQILSGQGDLPAYAEEGNPQMKPLATMVGVMAIADPATSVSDISQAIADACKASTQRHARAPDVKPCSVLSTINWLADTAGLNAIERDIFELAVAFRLFAPLRQALTSWGTLSPSVLSHVVFVLVGHSRRLVEQALAVPSALLRSGLVKTRNLSYDVGHLHALLSVPRMLARRIEIQHEGHPLQVLSDLVTEMGVPRLRLANFDHFRDSARLVNTWMAGAFARSRRGASAGHLLVTGEPGWGKTTWVRALLQEARESAQALPMELMVLDQDGSALSGTERLSHLRVALNMFRKSPNAILLFDEADDIFTGSGETATGEHDAFSMGNHRASLNRLVEESLIPIVWIMNNPDILDPAVLRRFDVVIRLEGIPRSVRAQMLQQQVPGVWEAPELKRWADVQNLTPALIDRLAILESDGQAAGVPLTADLRRLWLRQRLPGSTTRHITLPGISPAQGWSPDTVNASVDLVAVAQGIKRCGTARILLYGASGTGKTAFAHELARQLDKPLLEKRASDLLGAYVGQTEQRIAQAFSAALDEQAVLFLDEADSLLGTRDLAHRQWEVSQVNELLEQMGEFQGVIVLATNRLEALEPAVLRRLDMRIRFSPLRPDQVRLRFTQLCAQLGLNGPEPSDDACSAQLDRLTTLTPGDFAVLVRRHAFAPFANTDAVIDALRHEASLKNGGRTGMGFHTQFAAVAH